MRCSARSSKPELAPETSTETRYTYLAQEDGIWPTSRTPKPPPSYKRMPHTPFTVDAFKYGRIADCTGYFLTHFHSDHYGGLTRSFAGHVYCSRITANLVRHRLGVGERHVHALPMHRRCLVHGVYGAALILFEVPGETVRRIVHTGDFRAAPLHVRQIARVFATDLGRPVTPGMLGGEEAGRPSADYVYLDTTYLEPRYMFPPQSAVVAAVGELCCRIHQHTRLPALRITQCPRAHLFAVGTYTIGKEKLLVEIARRLNSQIYAAQDKRALLKRMLVDRPGEALVHAVSMQSVNMKGMAEYLEKNSGIRPHCRVPAHWLDASPGPLVAQPAHRRRCPRRARQLHCSPPTRLEFSVESLAPHGSSDRVTVFPVPYSEHSSFSELAQFVCGVDAQHVIPTVISSSDSNRAALAWLSHWGSRGLE
ncbi:hypothetical protein DL89DRAFT_277980 [Linderina pennispora]|uniref:DNA repair metallo-beta-lactamase domain-containing protein n=1 Tax=Linderina pennispora TaxID=61395 RepID=A0A1Y1WAW8_9FUNG|nr:uncharacterized protein DL89DRAFT_277980 [Linderina pennispora]ORX70515.1 hypothetical protein DL89DRAFT_277980 [Linderina pennispora]